MSHEAEVPQQPVYYDWVPVNGPADKRTNFFFRYRPKSQLMIFHHEVYLTCPRSFAKHRLYPEKSFSRTGPRATE